jgi:hypothetical protein
MVLIPQGSAPNKKRLSENHFSDNLFCFFSAFSVNAPFIAMTDSLFVAFTDGTVRHVHPGLRSRWSLTLGFHIRRLQRQEDDTLRKSLSDNLSVRF